MKRTAGFWAILFSFAILCITGCGVSSKKAFEVRSVSFSSLPAWKSDDLTDALPALIKNCDAMAAKPEWKTFCDGIVRLQGRPSKQIRRFIESTMTPYAVYSYGKRDGTFTGYYEASLSGSLTKDDTNQYPIYGIPEDLIALDTKTLCTAGSDTGTRIGRVENGRFLPYLTRSEIEKEALKAPVLLWVSDPVDAFILHIQGSGRVETSNGVYHIGYAGNNGHTFVGIGSILSADGVLENGKSSMPHIRAWLKENPEKAKEYMNKNPRYIFFKLSPEGDGPMGALGVPLTPKRSLAVDTRFIPLGTPLYLDTTDPDGNKVQSLVVAQDVGGAIKGAVRGDYFWGYGEDAFQNAGRMKSSGRYYILWPKGATPPASF